MPPKPWNERNKINQYWCGSCGDQIVTIDRDEGVTPMSLLCRATDGCPGRMISSMYVVDQTLEPGWEWYRPEKPPKNLDIARHVRMGGLLLRKIEDAGNDERTK